MYLRPTPDPSARDQLGLMVYRFALILSYIAAQVFIRFILENDIQFEERT